MPLWLTSPGARGTVSSQRANFKFDWGSETFKLAYFSAVISSSTCVNYKSHIIKFEQKHILEQNKKIRWIKTISVIFTKITNVCISPIVDTYMMINADRSCECTISAGKMRQEPTHARAPDY